MKLCISSCLFVPPYRKIIDGTDLLSEGQLKTQDAICIEIWNESLNRK